MPWALPLALLAIAYGLLGLTKTLHPGHADLMMRCVLMDPKLSRIWSVGHIEIGLAYSGVFFGMAYYVGRAARTDRTHLRDLALGFAYMAGSFLLDWLCVRLFEPFVALLIGDVVVLSFALLVSRQLWFQRLLGVFAPLVFLSCAIGHMLEGLSFWNKTYPLNVPWTMVTADIGFAVLANSSRFPAFIRGSDTEGDLAALRREASERHTFLREVLRVATENRLFFCRTPDELPDALPLLAPPAELGENNDMPTARRTAMRAAESAGFRGEDLLSVATIVGEAAFNAVKHGGNGTVAVRGMRGETLQIWVSDTGSGIPLDILPRAVLERGFSTASTAGQGFSLLLEMSHRVDLLTGYSGATLVFTRYAHPPTNNHFPLI